jgi:hypothetical protein
MFTKSPSVMRSKEEWLKIIENWKSSKKNVKDWCIENKIPQSSFHTAYKRFLPNKNQGLNLQRSIFKELKENYSSKADEIELTFKGVTLRFGKNFDESFLLNLLQVLERLK